MEEIKNQYRKGPTMEINVLKCSDGILKILFPEAYALKMQKIRPGVRFLRYD